MTGETFGRLLNKRSNYEHNCRNRKPRDSKVRGYNADELAFCDDRKRVNAAITRFLNDRPIRRKVGVEFSTEYHDRFPCHESTTARAGTAGGYGPERPQIVGFESPLSHNLENPKFLPINLESAEI